MNPAPPTTLNKETVRVWHGWINIGDKEVAREAAAKGLHVNLAITFLSLRKEVKFDDAQLWFKEEVVKWVYELLDRKQIFKASHVLKNVDLDASSEFSKIFYTTSDQNLREYVGNHLMKAEEMDENLQHLWSFLTLILDNEDLFLEYSVPIKSLECLDKTSNDVKSEMAIVLFLKTEDPRLTRFLHSDILWKHLLINNDLHNLLMWVNIRYNLSADDLVEGNLTELFKKFPITNQMIEVVASQELNISENIKSAVYNELSKFGIFRSEDRNDVITILKRLKDSFSMPFLYNVFEKPSSVLNLDNFLCLLIQHCLEHKYLIVLNTCLEKFKILPTIGKNEEINLICGFRSLVNNFDEIRLCENIFNMSSVLSTDILNYFYANPVIVLSLLFFTKKINAPSAILTKETLMVNNVKLNDCLESILKYFHILHDIVSNKLNGSPKCTLKLYDLITNHLGLDSQSLFEFQFKNDELSKFYVKNVSSYGYAKVVGYKFYLKESRPSIAAKLFTISELETDKSGTLDENDKKVEKENSNIAVANFNCTEISSSCVVFSEIIGLDSTKIRVLTRTANLLHGEHKASPVELVLNSEDDPHTVQKMLEMVLMEKIETNLFATSSDLIEAFKVYEIIIQYSKFNNIKFPESFLRYCASNNLWLPFLLLAQLHEYPLDQIKLLIQFFKSPNMLEHLTHGVVNDIHLEETNILIRERDSRKYLLSKVGVRRCVETVDPQSSLSVKSQSSRESGGSSTSSDLFEIDISNIKATLLQTLIRCHNSTDPPKALLQASQLYRNPLLAILATSYEPDSLVTNWLTWLSVSCETCKVFTNYETTALSANSVTNLLDNCLKHRYPKTVLESFEIFLPENPLKIFMEFWTYCFQLNFNNTILTQKLSSFEGLLKMSRKNSIISDTDHEMTYLNNKIWIELTALKLLAALLEYNCNSLYEQILVVRNLCKIKIWTYLSCEHPSFTNVLKILETLYYNNSGVGLDLSIMLDSKNSRQAIINCINKLLERQQYQLALQIAQIENLPPDLILVKEWQSKMNDQSDQNFWNTCNETFTKYHVTADCVVDFYIDCSEKISDLLEKFTLLKMACEWASKYELTCQYELEKKMWLAFLYLEEKHRNLDVFDIKANTYLYKDLIELVKDITPYEGELNKDFMSVLESILAFVLNKNNFWLALKLQKMFNCKNTDLETLKLCCSLAEGILLPYQLSAEQRLLLSNVNYLRTYSHRRTFLSTKFSSISSSSHSPAASLQMERIENIESYTNDTLAVLKLLTEHLHNGVEIAQNIFMYCRISINIEFPYHIVVVTTDYMKVLKDALEDNCANKLDVVHDFILAYKWSKHEIADFICEEIVNAVTSYTNLTIDHLLMWDLNMDQDFQLVLQLLQDSCSLLGYKLYSYASTLHKAHVESTQVFQISDLALIIELLIRAHDCFTTDCNMEGISIILKKCKEIVSNLLFLQDWKLMVRLLTGVARYTEMNYVFQILKENDQFEYLLRKGFRKDNTLKVALLEYLKKYCPDNKDLYKIVALHFALFSEVALLWEREAQNVIKNLISVSILEMQNNRVTVEEEPFILLQNTESTKICLNKAMENYIHATDFHLQGERLTKAANSAKQAELIALQMSLLNEVPQNTSVRCLLNLKKHQIGDLISTKLNFQQSLILVDAYNFHPDWALVLYEQYVVKNNVIFLEGFLQHLPLTDTLVHDISRKFVHSNVNSVNEVKYMKNILNRLNSLHMKYRIASELGFTDLIEDLIASGQLVYLKDTVWKKGYKN